MKRMLIVDDDERFRSRLSRAMSARGFDVVEAESSEDALENVVDGIDYAVVDLRMPGAGGLACVQGLRARNSEALILVLTGYGSIATTVDAMRLGASNYLSKPADADEILNAFEQAVREPATASAPSYEEAPSLARAEWEHINRVLNDCGGNISQAAKILGVHRRSLQRKLQKYPPKT